jgi:hypothetical protein
MFVIRFGLSMDYPSLSASAAKRSTDGLKTEEAVADGIKTSAGVVTRAALVIVGCVSIWGTMPTLDMQEAALRRSQHGHQR